MRIGILSDTHLTDVDISTQSSKYLFVMDMITQNFKDISNIIHAGDVYSEEFISQLSKIAPVSVVRGNMDENTGIYIWPTALTLELDNITIGIAHNLQTLLALPGISVGIYGHTHIPEIRENRPGLLLINPGSLTLPRSPPPRKLFPDVPTPKPSVAILTLEGDLDSNKLISAVLLHGKKRGNNNKVNDNNRR